jgi:hypothetical protein
VHVELARLLNHSSDFAPGMPSGPRSNSYSGSRRLEL